MLKAGIITFASAHNYGALLQTWAMQKYLEKLGIETHVINYRPKEIDNVYKLYKVKKCRSKLLTKIKKIKKIAITKIKYKWKIEKYNNFEEFINNKLNTTEPYIKLGQIQNAYLDYDILIAGSDQIWNTDLTKGFSPAYFLEFGRNDAIKISYAASLGRDDIDEKYALFYRRYLKNFDYISVREKSMIPILQKLTEKNIEQVLDPTLLLEKKDYDELKMDSKYKGKKYIYVHFIGKENKVIEIADKLSRELDIPILHNLPNKVFENELDNHFNERPEQLINVIENAQMIISNSFHLTVLSVIYKKQFITIPHAKRPERMKNLLELLDLGEHLIEDVRVMPNIETLKINYENVENKLKIERQNSIEFLKNAIFNKKPEAQSNYFLSKDKFECYGCGLCADICPVGAITMKEDSEGFVYPLIDEEKCIHCNLCKNKCIYRKNIDISGQLSEPKIYAIMNKDEEVINKSSSGGVFTALYEKIIGEGGYVVGVRYDENMRAIYDIVNTIEECEKFRGSKYVSASIENVRNKVKEKLEEGKKVLFSGNPCQIVALRKYLGKEYENLYLVELICNSAPSPKVFRRYIEYLNNKFEKKVNNFEFRNKKNGWKKETVKITFEDGEEVYELGRYNNYHRAFMNGFICRPGCYNCEFTGDTRKSDIVIGDYWGIDDVIPGINKDTGISVMKINTEKGEKIFNDIKEKMEYYESNFEDAYKKNHKFPIQLSLKRYELMQKIDDMNINKLLLKYNQLKKRKKRTKK